MTCKWQVEIDDYATRVLERHWPAVPRWRDIADFIADAEHSGRKGRESVGLRTAAAMPSEKLAVDLICGGPPCQPVSLAGKRKAMADERWLWDSFREVVQIIRPQYVLVENVPGLLSADAGRAFGNILRDLAILGYDATWDVLPAAAFGAPHLRKRAFLVANANEKRLEGTKPQQERDLQLLGIGNQGILGAGWRSVEPTVRRGDHGVPFELDFIGRLNDEQSYDSEANATGIWTDIAIRFLRSVWEYQELAKASPELFQDRVLASVPEVSYGNTHGGWYVGARLEKDESLRDLWQEFYAFPLEGEIMLESLLKRIRQEKRKQAVENRVDRLRTLGNAVVPHVAEWIGRRIIRMDVK